MPSLGENLLWCNSTEIFKHFYYFLCMGVLPACVSVHQVCVWCLLWVTILLHLLLQFGVHEDTLLSSFFFYKYCPWLMVLSSFLLLYIDSEFRIYSVVLTIFCESHGGITLLRSLYNTDILLLIYSLVSLNFSDCPV